jgi:repressor LexA
MMKDLTPRQKEVLGFIKTFIRSHKFPPTIREVSSHFDISVKGAYDHVKALEKKNYIRCDMYRSRAIEVLDDEETESLRSVPVLGNVAAGRPLFAEENYDGSIDIPVGMLPSGKHFALHVRGDSMEGAGIMDGDIAVFRHQPDAESGNIVVAMVDEAFTLKRFYREKNRVRLKSETPAYPPIYTQNVRILGRLACIIRTYE